MPKAKESLGAILQRLIKGHDCFTTDGKVLYCQTCSKTVNCTKKFHIDQHLRTALHISNSKIVGKRTSVQTFLTQPPRNDSADEFSFELCEAMLAANIAWNKVQIPKFREFLEKYCKRTIPNESTLRKNYLPRCYDLKLQYIRDAIGDHDIWATVDETTDANGRSIANMIVGILSSDKPGIGHLIACKELDKTNNATISRFVNDSLKLLWPDDGKDDKFRILYTDAAAYMLKAGRNLKVFHENLIHFTCLAHGVNLIAETLRNQFPNINKLVSTTKKVFLKAPLRRDAYREKLPNIALPPEPILTRWGTWIEAVIFYNEHFSAVKSLIESFDRNEAQSISAAQDAFKNSSVAADLAYIACNFKIIVQTIKALENSGETVFTSFERITRLLNQLKDAPGNAANAVVLKLESVLSKNPGYDLLHGISKVLSGQSTIIPLEVCGTDISIFKYAPVTSCDVERSFSVYKQILTDNRRQLTPENLEKILVCNIGGNCKE